MDWNEHCAAAVSVSVEGIGDPGTADDADVAADAVSVVDDAELDDYVVDAAVLVESAVVVDGSAAGTVSVAVELAEADNCKVHAWLLEQSLSLAEVVCCELANWMHRLAVGETVLSDVALAAVGATCQILETSAVAQVSRNDSSSC